MAQGGLAAALLQPPHLLLLVLLLSGAAAQVPLSAEPTLAGGGSFGGSIGGSIGSGGSSSQSAGCKRVIWFMGLSENREADVHDTFWQQLMMSVRSARVHAPSLQPVLIWMSPPSQRSRWFEQMGGLVLYHNLTFFHLLQEAVDKGWRDSYWLKFDGAYARLDAPLLMQGIKVLFDPTVYETGYVFYTDVDVIFFKDINSCTLPKPRYLMYGGESEKGTIFNTGVVYMNVSAMVEERDAMLAFAHGKQWDFPALDQGMLNEYFAGRTEQLPDELNWKIYWGYDPNISILHFHGPKPAEKCYQCFVSGVRDWEDSPTCNCKNPSFPGLFQRAVDADGGKLMRVAYQLFEEYTSPTYGIPAAGVGSSVGGGAVSSSSRRRRRLGAAARLRAAQRNIRALQGTEGLLLPTQHRLADGVAVAAADATAGGTGGGPAA